MVTIRLNSIVMAASSKAAMAGRGVAVVAASTGIDGPTGRANSAGEALESPLRLLLQVTVGVEAPVRQGLRTVFCAEGDWRRAEVEVT